MFKFFGFLFLLQCFGSCLSWFWSKCFSFLVGLFLHLGLLVHQILHFLGLLLHLGLLVHHFCFSRIICAPWIVGLLVHVMAACCCFFVKGKAVCCQWKKKQGFTNKSIPKPCSTSERQENHECKAKLASEHVKLAGNVAPLGHHGKHGARCGLSRPHLLQKLSSAVGMDGCSGVCARAFYPNTPVDSHAQKRDGHEELLLALQGNQRAVRHLLRALEQRPLPHSQATAS